jgi:hypothetical protein
MERALARITTTLRLAHASSTLVRRDPWVVALPALSATAIVAVALLAVIPGVAVAGPDHRQAGLLMSAALAAYPVTAVGLFFRLAFAAVISGALDGRRTTVREGLLVAWRRRDAVVRWALVATIAAAVLRALRQLPLVGGLAASISSWLLGTAWSTMSLFIVPVIAIEDVRGRRALDRSMTLIREHWGQEAASPASISGVFALAFAAGLAIEAGAQALVFNSPVASTVVVSAAAVGLLACLLAASAVRQSFGVALYRYATGRPLPAGFLTSDLQAAVHRRRPR